MISSADFTRSSSGAARWHAQQTQGGPPGGTADSCWGDLTTAAGEVSWPPTGSFLAAYGEVLMAADIVRPRPTDDGGCVLRSSRSLCVSLPRVDTARPSRGVSSPHAPGHLVRGLPLR